MEIQLSRDKISDVSDLSKMYTHFYFLLLFLLMLVLLIEDGDAFA